MNIFCYECDLFTFVSGLEQSKVLRTTIAFSSTSRVFACETIANIVKRIIRNLGYNWKQKRFFTLNPMDTNVFFALEYQGGGLFCPSKFGILSIEIRHCVFGTIYSFDIL